MWVLDALAQNLEGLRQRHPGFEECRQLLIEDHKLLPLMRRRRAPSAESPESTPLG
jgi:hypothetical protein